MAGIPVLATGGIGGVHRGASESHDISADLYELSRRQVAVVCAGAKAILDLPATLEVLESLSVPVIGYETDALPAFFCRESGLLVTTRVDDLNEMARLVCGHWSLPSSGGLVFAVPPPEESALTRKYVEDCLLEAEEKARKTGISGPALTPYLLGQMDSLSDGKTRESNKALLRRNAEVAADFATSLSQEKQHSLKDRP
jgi:pseudouridine-5'-phosphate glycosidase